MDRRSDVLYSLGVILYELLCGELPFRGSTPMLVHQVLHEEPQAPRRLNSKIPQDLETICLKALAKEPGRRYVTARALAEDLRRWLNGEPIRARPVGKLEKLWRWSRRNPTVARLAAAVAVLLLTVAVGATVAAFRFAAARNETEMARKDAENEAEAKRRQLVALYVTNGMRLVDEGDLFGALPSLAQALVIDKDDPERAEMHRDRLAAVLQQCPKLVHLWSHDDKVVHAEFDVAGRRVVTASDDGTARVWDVVTGHRLATLKHSQAVRHAAFSPDSCHIVTASADSTARLWDAVTGQLVAGPLQHPQEVKRAAFSPNRRWLVPASADKTARVWDAATGQHLHTLMHSHPVAHAVFSPDSALLLTVSNTFQNSEVFLWDAATGQQLRRLKRDAGGDHKVVYAAFSPDGRQVVTAGTPPIYNTGMTQV